MHQTLYLQWRGQRLGPWSLDEINRSLETGQIHSLYQVHVEGEWKTLRDYLAEQDLTASTQRREQEVASNAAMVTRREYEQKLSTEKATAENLRRQLQQTHEAQRQQVVSSQPQSVSSHPGPQMIAMQMVPQTSGRISGLAVASFVLSLCNFIPFVNLISWLLSIIFGHVALANISKDPNLGGRGLAIAGLVITYSLFALGLIFALFLMAASNGVKF